MQGDEIHAIDTHADGDKDFIRFECGVGRYGWAKTKDKHGVEQLKFREDEALQPDTAESYHCTDTEIKNKFVTFEVGESGPMFGGFSVPEANFSLRIANRDVLSNTCSQYPWSSVQTLPPQDVVEDRVFKLNVGDIQDVSVQRLCLSLRPNSVLVAWFLCRSFC